MEKMISLKEANEKLYEFEAAKMCWVRLKKELAVEAKKFNGNKNVSKLEAKVKSVGVEVIAEYDKEGVTSKLKLMVEWLKATTSL